MSAPHSPELEPGNPELKVYRVFWWRYSSNTSREMIERHTRSMKVYSDSFYSKESKLFYSDWFQPGSPSFPGDIRRYLNSLPRGSIVHFHVRGADGMVSNARQLMYWWREFSHLNITFHHFQYYSGGMLTGYATNLDTFYDEDCQVNEFPPLTCDDIYFHSLGYWIPPQKVLFCRLIEDLARGRALPGSLQERNVSRNQMPPGWEDLV